MFEAAGVRVCFSGHEHNFQHSHWNGIEYFVSGAGSKVRRSVPNGFAEAHTLTWSGECHFLLVTIDGSTMTVRAIGESPDGAIGDIPRLTPSGEARPGTNGGVESVRPARFARGRGRGRFALAVRAGSLTLPVRAARFARGRDRPLRSPFSHPVTSFDARMGGAGLLVICGYILR